MIVLDTQIWRWWIDATGRLSARQQEVVVAEQPSGLGVSVISCWEIANAVEVGRLTLSVPVEQWIDRALAHPSVVLLDFTPRIAVESTRLPQPFHRDPGDQMIVATARVHDCALLTAHEKILAYPHVKLAR